MIALEDRELMADALGEGWEALRGRSVFVTGATGFVGSWLLEAFAQANRERALGARLVALSRDPARFRGRAPHLAADPAISLLAGDATVFAGPSGPFSYVIHAATEAPVAQGADAPLGTIERDLAATLRVLEFARRAGTERMLFTSSGAAYGVQPEHLTHLPESYPGGPLTTSGPAYGHSKRLSEFACASYGRCYGFATVVARLFAFVGAYLPLNANFAVGNFIGDALAGRRIRVLGDGTTRRSYLYGADLAVWLWTMLLRGQPGRLYNVGSPLDLSIRELAEAVSLATGTGVGIDVAGSPASGEPALRYVPDTSRAELELGLSARVGLHEAIRRTFEYHRRSTS